MVLKNNLKEFRQKKGLTQEQLADLVGVSRQTIISIERYRYKPTLELGLKLALTLDIKVEGLFYFE
ncbi:MAG: transcriptional regulator [Flavobacteriaceae bacterium]|nr:transcriptional regulator [Flavobacteriaceae bacterium]